MSFVLPRDRGTARFATTAELKKQGLLEPEGILLARPMREGPLGGWKPSRDILRLGREGHVALIAPSGTGKTAGVIVPNALTWPDTLFVTDIKPGRDGVYWKTAGRRLRMGQRVHALDPFGITGATRAGINLLSTIDPASPATGAIRVARIVAPGGTGDYWQRSATTLIAGLVAHVCGCSAIPPDKRHLGTVHDMLWSGNSLRGHLDDMEGSAVRYVHQVAKTFGDMWDTAKRQFLGVQGNAQALTDFLFEDSVARTICAGDCDLRTLKSEKQTVYFAMPDSQVKAYGIVVRLVIDSIVSAITAASENPGNHPLLLIDEFANIGAMHDLVNSLAYLRSYGAHVVLAAQNTGQIVDRYNAELFKHIMSECNVKIFMGPNDVDTQEYVSRLLGSRRVAERQWSDRPSGGSDVEDVVAGLLSLPFAGRSAFQSKSEQKLDRPLLSPDEIAAMDRRTAFVFRQGIRPVLARSMAYYEDRAFLDLILPPPQPRLRAHPPPVPKPQYGGGNAMPPPKRPQANPGPPTGKEKTMTDTATPTFAEYENLESDAGPHPQGSRITRVTDEDRENTTSRLPLVLVVDLSSSMRRHVSALVAGLRRLKDECMDDILARNSVEVLLITFNSGVSVHGRIETVANWQPPPSLSTAGCTHMGTALLEGISHARGRREALKSENIPSCVPHLFLLTDGEPLGEKASLFGEAGSRIRELEAAKKMHFNAAYVPGANKAKLLTLTSQEHTIVELGSANFVELFRWLSQSLKAKSSLPQSEADGNHLFSFAN